MHKFMTLNKSFALRLTGLLVENKTSKYLLEKISGLSHSALRNIFNENNKEVRLSTVAKAANVFDLSLSEFFSHEVFDLTKIEYE